MSTLLKFLLISISILWIIRAVFRWLLPMFFQSVISKAQQQAQAQYNNQQRGQQQQPNGRIKVEYAEAPKSKIPDNEGEFVDYEEVK
jgi:type II secretory pathway pseudopilin PulG